MQWIIGAIVTGAMVFIYWYQYEPTVGCYHPREGRQICGYGDITLPVDLYRPCDFSDVGC